MKRLENGPRLKFNFKVKFFSTIKCFCLKLARQIIKTSSFFERQLISSTQMMSLQALPNELLAHIFIFIDAKSITACSQTSQTFSLIVKERLWKQVSMRDYLSFLQQIPLNSRELILPSKENQIQIIREPFIDANMAIEELENGKSRPVEGLLRSSDEWINFYKKQYQGIDLNGYWIGDYGKHGSELIRIYQSGYNVFAKKITGDVNIPAGKLTWQMQLDDSRRKGRGLIQVAEKDFEDPKQIQAHLEVVNKDFIKITWFFKDVYENWYAVTFSSIRAGCISFDEKTMNRKIDYLALEKDLEASQE